MRINQGELAEVILIRGFDLAVESITLMTGKKVGYRLLGPSTIQQKIIGRDLNRNTDMKILYTELMGELDGVSYLIMDDKESKFLTNQMYFENLDVEFLKELDNIISAGVVSSISNSLLCKLYGDVPRLKILPTNQTVASLLEKSSEEYKGSFMTAIELQFDDEDIRPLFVWILDKTFLHIAEKNGFVISAFIN